MNGNRIYTMEDSIKQVCINLTKQQELHIEIAEEILEHGGGFCRFHTYIHTLIKRSIDILDTFIYATSTYNLNTQIPLLRLQIDSCIALYGILLLEGSDDVLSSLLSGKHRWNICKHPTTKEKLSESKIAKELGENPKYKSFYEMYQFCCKFVHFSGNIVHSTLQFNSIGGLKAAICLGNKDMPKDVLINANSMLETTKVLFELVEKAVAKNEGAEILTEL